MSFPPSREAIIDAALCRANQQKNEVRRVARIVSAAPLTHGVNAARMAALLVKRREHSAAYLPEHMHELRCSAAYKKASPLERRAIVRAVETEYRALREQGGRS